MPTRSKGCRLYLRRENGKPSVWIIRDGSRQIRTGCTSEQRGEAEQRLADYIAAKYRPDRTRGRDPAQITIADVLNIYLTDKAPTLSRPHELGQRVKRLAQFCEDRTLEDINGAFCREYVKRHGSASMAKRELEDLRAAVNHHAKEGLCSATVRVWVPEKAEPRDRWLTRSEAARLLWAAWRYREVQKGRATARRSRQHIARFVLVALYTGTRAGAVCAASLERGIGRSFIDLENGTFERKPLGSRRTKKRQPPVRLPDRLLAHIRRWHRLGLCTRAVVQWDGQPVKRVDKAFGRAAKDAGLGADVNRHTLRHTAVTWAMQNRADLWDAADFFGMSVETLIRHYGHHHPDHGKEVAEAITTKRKRRSAA